MSVENIERILDRELALRRRSWIYLGLLLAAILAVVAAVVTAL